MHNFLIAAAFLLMVMLPCIVAMDVNVEADDSDSIAHEQ
jgi:hypothetical protein